MPVNRANFVSDEDWAAWEADRTAANKRYDDERREGGLRSLPARYRLLEAQNEQLASEVGPALMAYDFMAEAYERLLLRVEFYERVIASLSGRDVPSEARPALRVAA